MTNWKEEIYIKSKSADTANELVRIVTELLQRQKDEDAKDADAMFENGYDAGYNSAREELLKWAEEKVGENHDKLLQELLEELK